MNGKSPLTLEDVFAAVILALAAVASILGMVLAFLVFLKS